MLTKKFTDKIECIIKGYSPQVILDIGSRDLDQSFEFKITYPKAKIIAFEPNPEQTEYILSREPAENGIDFFPVALGNTESSMLLHIPYGGNHGASSILEPLPSWAVNKGFYTKTVPIKRLDSILETLKISKIDIVWIDVQGYELTVLDGFGSLLQNVDFIHLEAAEIPYYKGHPDKSKVIDYLNKNGFSILHFEIAEGHPNREGDLYVVNNKLLND